VNEAFPPPPILGEAAERAGLDSVPCWVREMDDATAYMELVRANAQSELTALERGMHALGFVEKGKHGKSAEAYAKEVGREKEVRSVRREIDAAEVAHKIGDIADLTERFHQLTEIQRRSPLALARAGREDGRGRAAIRQRRLLQPDALRQPGDDPDTETS
jgi:hypothetical protein